MAETISIENLTKYYGKTRGIENLTLTIQDNEIFGFLGPNGAGKTTTIRSILGLLHPNSGNVKILGIDFQNLTKDLYKRIGYLPGESYLYSNMNGQEYLDFFLSFHGKSKEYQQELIKKFSKIKLDRPIKTLSTGQKRLIGVVSAFQHSPDLYILDEPTTGLDPLMQQTLYTLIKQEKEKGKTFFFSSHNLYEVQILCDRVGIVRDGFLVKTDSIENLVNIRLKHVYLKVDESIKEWSSKLHQEKEFEDIRVLGDTIKFRYSGDYEKLIHTLGEFNKISDITIKNPTLEEIFLQYYSYAENQEGRI
ncbi:MAG: ABC transporter ATP-binding protein [Candidatus Hodarchaeota archaeon]